MIDPVRGSWNQKPRLSMTGISNWVELVFHNQLANSKYSKEFFLNLIGEAATQLGLDRKKISLSINIVSPARIRSLNRRYLGQDRVTDVLAFPVNSIINLHGNGGIIDLGDIFICPAVGRQKARQENKPLTEVIAFLAVHGFLHLLGYDHEGSPNERKKMFNIQNRILKQPTKSSQQG